MENARQIYTGIDDRHFEKSAKWSTDVAIISIVYKYLKTLQDEGIE